MAQLTARQVSDYILYKANEAGELITNLKLQKLLYYAQGYYLALYKKPLFDDEIEAWVHGPVVPNIYHVYKKLRWKPIIGKVTLPTLPKKITEYLDLVIKTFLPIDAYKLELMTHQEMPWKVARKGLPKDAVCQRSIELKNMRAYFSKLIANE